jgi:uncharacterized protein (DUF1684 family)
MTKIALALMVALTAGSITAQSGDYERQIEAWRAERVQNLTSETGWLTLAGLHRLDPGDHILGSGPEADIELPAAAPARLGTLHVADGTAELEVDPGVTVTVEGTAVTSPAAAFDVEGEAPLFEVGAVNFFVIQRGDLLLLRVRDREHADRRRFAGIESFPIDPAYRLAARFEPYEPVKQIPIANIIGVVSDTPCPGAVVFERAGETYRLDALAEPGDEELFLIFGDLTSGHETYGAGRYMYVERPDAEGRIDLDFNKAYNPPCAFTPFATCPLPPVQNRLPLRIEAGEKTYEH